MTTQATPNANDKAKGGILHMAMELSQKQWLIAFSDGARRRQVTVAARDLKALGAAIEAAKVKLKLPVEARVVSCYEAGRDGFWIDRALKAMTVENLIMDSSSIEVNRRRRRAKNDRIDAGKLLTLLERYVRGEPKAFAIVHALPEEDEDFRRPVRELKRLNKEAGALVSRIRSHLATQGIELGPVGGKDWPQTVAKLKLWDGKPLGQNLQQGLLRDGERLALVCRQIREIKAQFKRLEKQARETAAAGNAAPDAPMQKVVRLQGMRSVGPATAWILTAEFFGWRRFQNRRQVGSAAGLTGTPYASGSMDRDQGIDKAGNTRVRSVMNQIAWLWLRYQPNSALAHWYNERFGAGTKRQRRVGIVALMRKLLIALWRYVEFGEIPEGAELKPGAVL